MKISKLFLIAPVFITLLTVFFLTPFLKSAAAENGKSGQVAVVITDTQFEPREITIVVGDTVTFKNAGANPHWPASNIHPTHSLYPGSDIRKCETIEAKKIFDACKLLEHGEEFSFTFQKSGVWGFHDHVTPGMSGAVTVEDSTSAELKKHPARFSLGLGENTKIIFYKILYKIFPAQLEKKFDELEMDTLVYDNSQLRFWLATVGYDKVIQELLEDSYLGELNGTPIYHCHTPAHYVGRMTYYLLKTTAFEESIDGRCDFGFYHGTLEAFLGERGGDDDVVTTLHKRCLESGDETIRIFCEHGIGHGVLVYNNYDLPEALTACQTFPNNGTQQLCYHGVFMENAFAHLGLGVEHITPWADDGRPDFPCTYLSDVLKDSLVDEQCYFGQSLLWAAPFANFNVPAVLEGCMRAPEYARNSCYAGLGFSAGAPQAFMENDKLIATCVATPNTVARDYCFAGIFFMRATVWQEKGNLDKLRFCRVVQFNDVELCEKHFREMLPWVFKR